MILVVIFMCKHNNHRSAEEISQRKFAYRKPEKPCSSISSAKSNRYAKLDINPPGGNPNCYTGGPTEEIFVIPETAVRVR